MRTIKISNHILSALQENYKALEDKDSMTFREYAESEYFNAENKAEYFSATFDDDTNPDNEDYDDDEYTEVFNEFLDSI